MVFVNLFFGSPTFYKSISHGGEHEWQIDRLSSLKKVHFLIVKESKGFHRRFSINQSEVTVSWDTLFVFKCILDLREHTVFTVIVSVYM